MNEPESLPALAAPKPLLEAWLDGKSPGTADAYTRDLRDFARFVRCGADPGSVLETFFALGPGPANSYALSYRNGNM